MTELQALALLVAVWVGALMALPLPTLSVGVLALGALALRKPWWFVASGFLLASALGARAEEAHQPIAAGQFDDEVVLVTDPEVEPFRVRAEARLPDGSRVRFSIDIPAAFAIEDTTAGYRLRVTGRLRPIDQTDWVRSRHLVGRLDATSVAIIDAPPWWQRPSEAIRRAVAGSAGSFDPEDAALYTGLVIGDDRRQSPAQTARFRLAGMSHLLAVSGQNVAFALAVVWPIASRLPGSARLTFLAVVLAVFAIATRLEPSVVRATVTAGVGAWSAYLGRRATGVRTLSLGVAGLILIDPFLVLSIGFRLSVAATTGILLCAPLVASRMPGPRPLALAVSITLSAQLLVAPILVVTFGPVSLVSLPANILAGWAAGIVMIWGLSVGLLAAIIPSAARAIQWPVKWLLWWIDEVARRSVGVPAPSLGLRGLLTLTILGAGSWLVWRYRVGRILALCGVAVALWLARPETAGSGELVGGGTYWAGEAGSSVLVVNADADLRLVESVIDARLGEVGVVVFERAGPSARQLNVAIVDVADASLVLAPPLHRLVGARAVREEQVLVVADAELRLSPDGTRLSVVTKR